MKKIAFISGHRDITDREFRTHYRAPILEHAKQGYSFIVGDCSGVDAMAQEFLADIDYILGTEDFVVMVTIYHMLDYPRNTVGFPAIGGFKSDKERDTAMTNASDVDIAWVRPGKESSGTAQNIERRNKKNAKILDSF